MDDMSRHFQTAYQLGFSRRKITPTGLIKLSGYYPLREADGVHDDLWVRSHVFLNQDLGEIVIFSSFDLVAVDVKLKEVLLDTLEYKYPKLKINVFVSATHTHSASAGTLDTNVGVKQSFANIFGQFNKEYFSYCIDQCLSSIEESLSIATTFYYRLLIDKVDDVGKDRHHIANEGDPRIVVLEFTLENQAKSLLYVYSCHPTVLSHENKQISADLPWGVTRLLEKEYQVVQFINGNSGNISTRYTRESADFTQVQIFGEQLIEVILGVQNEPKQNLDKIVVRTEHAVLKVKEKEDAYLELLATEHVKSIREICLEYSIIQFGPLLFLTIPGEITSDLTASLRETFHQLFILGYTNDYLFYFASERMFEANNYEALSSFLQKGEMEKLMANISKQIEGIT